MLLFYIFYFKKYKKKTELNKLLYTSYSFLSRFHSCKELKKFQNIRTIWIKSISVKFILATQVKKYKNENTVKSKKNLKKNPIFFFSSICSDFLLWQICYTLCISLPPNKLFSKKLIAKNKNIFFYRPLLAKNRFDIQKICFFCQLPFYPDKTNQKVFYYRNRIRKQFLPAFRFFFNPQVEKLLFQFSEIISDEQNYFNQIINQIYQKLEYKKNIYIYLEASILFKLPHTLCRNIIKQNLETSLTKRITFFTIETLFTCLKKKNSPSFYNLQFQKYFQKQKFISQLDFSTKQNCRLKKKKSQKLIKEPIVFFFPKKGLYLNYHFKF